MGATDDLLLEDLPTRMYSFCTSQCRYDEIDYAALRDRPLAREYGCLRSLVSAARD
jgi:hypothetical protein